MSETIVRNTSEREINDLGKKAVTVGGFVILLYPQIPRHGLLMGSP